MLAVVLAVQLLSSNVRKHLRSIMWPCFVKRSKISSARGRGLSSWVSHLPKCLHFLLLRDFSQRFALLASSIQFLEIHGYIDWKQSGVRRRPLIFPPLMQYFPLHSQVINLPVIGETHWHLSIKWHLIYALFMPHLCAQVLQLFIKCPLSCQSMEIERRYSWYLRQTHQRTGSHRGPRLTVTRKSCLGDCLLFT